MAERSVAETKKYELKIITPMFLAGADGETPELRPSSFKGCMRYWWRAAVAVADIKDLHRREAELFGSSAEGSGRSPVTIKLEGRLEPGEYRPLPHSDNKQFTLNGFKPGQTFELILSARKNLELYADILELSLILGGVGKRSRRGFGSVVDVSRDFRNRAELIDHILAKLQAVTGSREFRRMKDDRREFIITRDDGVEGRDGNKYPWIKEIFIGQELAQWKMLVERIGQASHDHNDPSLGSAGPRMASPVYVSAVMLGGKIAPVVTTLNPVFPERYPVRNSDSDMTKQESFKGAL